MSFNSIYTQIWRVLLHLAADPYPDVSDLAMKVLNSIAYKVNLGGVENYAFGQHIEIILSDSEFVI